MIEKYFYEEFGMESLKFKGTNEEFKDKNLSPSGNLIKSRKNAKNRNS
jgi:hypothetical protein